MMRLREARPPHQTKPIRLFLIVRSFTIVAVCRNLPDKYIQHNTEREKAMAKENGYLGSFRLSQLEYEEAVALAKSRDWSFSKLIRRSIQATIAAAKQAENERRPA
jgi:hypothetical protein